MARDRSTDEDDEDSPPPRSRRRRAPSPPPESSEETSETDSDLENGKERTRGGGRLYARGGGSYGGGGRSSGDDTSSEENQLLSTDDRTSSEDGDEPPPYSRSRPRPRPRVRRAPPPSADPPDAGTAHSSQQILILGGVFVLCLLALGGFAIYKYENSSGTSGDSVAAGDEGGVTATVTVTASGADPIATAKNSAGVGEAAGSSTSSSSGDGDSAPAASDSGSTSTSSAGSNSTSSGSDGLTGTHVGISKNGLGIGFLPDYNNQNMAAINEGLGLTSAYYGWYAQLPADGADWDGSQLLSQLDDIKASGAIFQPAVMPTKGWKGLTADDNAQALSIAKVMKQFTDAGIIVWLRFAHEVNYYQTDGTYQGDADDFKAGWAAVADAVAANPSVYMFFTPNIASLEQYQQFFPDDASTVHIIGIDYYPKTSSENFVDKMRDFYDAYCKDGTIKFAIGETGTGWQATIEERLAWLDQCTSAATAEAMPHYVGVSWFNYDKEEDFRLWISGDDSVNSVSKAWFSDGTEAAGGEINGA